MIARLIEASAGTGKTYRLEEEITALIAGGIALEKILVVTFTEKATAELRARIRRRLSREAADPARVAQSDRFREALARIDQASILTIHGFCHHMLREFAFEFGTELESELVDDAVLREALLADIVREWIPRYGERLADILLLSKYPQQSARDGSSLWESRVIQIASRLRDGDVIWHEDRICPDLQWQKSILEKIQTALFLFGEYDPNDLDRNLFIADYKKRMKQNTRNKTTKLLVRFGEEFFGTALHEPLLRRFIRFVHSMKDDFDSLGKDGPIPENFANFISAAQTAYTLVMRASRYLE